MAKGIPVAWLVGGALVLGGAFVLWQNPNIIQNILHPPAAQAAPLPAGLATVTQTPTVVSTTPTSSVVTPPLSQIEGGSIIPYQQNVFCDPTLGLNWDPLQGRCVQSLQASTGKCAPGSHFDHCQCTCVPNGIPQPQCYRDCTTSCSDKINQIWSNCVLGCIPKSAAYGDPRLLACPPM